MPKKCVIKHCSIRTSKYHFPTKDLQRKLWIDAVRQHNRTEERLGKENYWSPSSTDVVCPEHFVSGKKSAFPGHDGFVPTIFPTASAKSGAAQTNGNCPVVQPPPVLSPRPFKEHQPHQQQRPQLIQSGASLPGGSPPLQQQAPLPPGRTPPLTSNPIAPHTPLPQSITIEPTPAEPAPGFNSYPSSRGRPRIHENANWIVSRQTPTLGDHDYLPSMFKISDTPLSELEELSKKCQEMEEELNDMKSRSISLESCKSDKDMNYYTGFPNYATFFALFSYLEEKASVMNMWRGSQTSSNPSFSTNKPGCNSKLTLEECYFLTLVRLRTGMSVEQLARAFGISTSQTSRIFTSWVNLLYIELKDICELPSKNVTDENRSKSFTVFNDLRITLDCTELFIQTPKNLTANKQTFSSYKHHNTYKFLVGLSPQCAVTYVSSMWGGRASDKKITEASGDLIVNMEEGGGIILTDRGFDNIFSSSELEVMMPAFKGRDRVQFSADEVAKSAKISNVRVHVERIIGRIKNFQILSGNLRLSMKDTTEQIFTVCAYLTNFQTPILQDHDIQM